MATESRKGIKKSRCAICFAKHDNPKAFPTDFPMEWRMCCNCKGYAGHIALFGIEDIIRYFKKHFSTIRVRTFTKRAKKIDKLIRVV